MYTLIFTEQFDKSFKKIKDRQVKKQIWIKILQLEERAPLGKKLKDNPYWSIHVGKYRVIYQLGPTTVTIAEILPRKHDYREL